MDLWQLQIFCKVVELKEFFACGPVGAPLSTNRF
jgi:hypothetical protein